MLPNTNAHTVLSVIVSLAQKTREGRLKALDANKIIDVAKVKRDRRRDGCNGPATVKSFFS